jgi:hypothetical protein
VDLPGVDLRGEKPAINRLRFGTALLKTPLNLHLMYTHSVRISQKIQCTSLDQFVNAV